MRTLESGGVLNFQISGESMTPVLRPGDRIEVIRCRVEDLVPGDVVLLSGLVVHRFLYRTPQGLVVRGDGALSADPFRPAALECARQGSLACPAHELSQSLPLMKPSCVPLSHHRRKGKPSWARSSCMARSRGHCCVRDTMGPVGQASTVTVSLT